jgi:hypothetical protein
MKKAGELRKRAEGYRRIRKLVTDDRAAKALDELADESDMTAAELEKRHLLRERAHEIWIERGSPEGRDVEFWLEAEQELEGKKTRRRQA